MGPLTWLAALGVLGLGFLAGAPWWAVLGAGLLYGAVPLTGGRGIRVVLLVAAPAGVAAATGEATPAGMAVAAAAMALAMVPLMRALGPGVPWTPLPWFFAAALAPMLLLRLSPWGHMSDSDLAARVDIALAAVGLLLAHAFAPHVRRARIARPQE